MATSIMHGPSWLSALAKAAVISPAVLALRPRPLGGASKASFIHSMSIGSSSGAG